MKRATLAYKPLGTLLGAVAGVLVGAVFDRAWQAVTHTDHVPRATEQEQRWDLILLAAALQGAAFGVVKAVVDRGSAHAVRRFTGQWPD